MELGLLRHADACPANGGLIPTDAVRPLSALGHDQARDVGLFLRRIGQIPNLIMCSPLRRTRETSEGLQRGLGKSVDIIVLPELACEVETSIQAEAIAQALQNAKAARHSRVIAVGHMPDLALLAAYYMCGSEGSLDFEKAALATFAFPNLPTAELGRLLQWTTPAIHSLCSPINDELAR
jgi:phosphohistidine phosphatase